MSETSDAMVIVVSEETGVVSIAEKGALERYVDAGQLKARLSALYEEKLEKPAARRGFPFRRKRHE